MWAWINPSQQSMAQKIAQWPQLSTIQDYFQHTPDGTVTSLSAFTWFVHGFLTTANIQAWEAMLGMQGGTHFMNTLICPPLCPLHHWSHGCGCNVAQISTSHRTPSLFSLVHWAWELLSMTDRAVLCHLQADTQTDRSQVTNHPLPQANVLLAYAKLHAMACS